MDYTDDYIGHRIGQKRSEFAMQGVVRQNMIGRAGEGIRFSDDAHPVG